MQSGLVWQTQNNLPRQTAQNEYISIHSIDSIFIQELLILFVSYTVIVIFCLLPTKKVVTNGFPIVLAITDKNF